MTASLSVSGVVPPAALAHPWTSRPQWPNRPVEPRFLCSRK